MSVFSEHCSTVRFGAIPLGTEVAVPARPNEPALPVYVAVLDWVAACVEMPEGTIIAANAPTIANAPKTVSPNPRDRRDKRIAQTLFHFS
jgi:hypothetical protein